MGGGREKFTMICLILTNQSHKFISTLYTTSTVTKKKKKDHPDSWLKNCYFPIKTKNNLSLDFLQIKMSPDGTNYKCFTVITKQMNIKQHHSSKINTIHNTWLNQKLLTHNENISTSHSQTIIITKKKSTKNLYMNYFILFTTVGNLKWRTAANVSS